MWGWLWQGQFTRGEELIVAVVTMFIGLYAEDWIDGWRERRGRK